jgi:hypothetical protein
MKIVKGEIVSDENNQVRTVARARHLNERAKDHAQSKKPFHRLIGETINGRVWFH